MTLGGADVVHQNVELAEGLVHRREHALDIGRVAGVGGQGQRAPSLRLDRRPGFAQPILLEIAERDIRASAGHTDGNCLADAVAAAGNQGHPPIESKQ